MRRSLAALVLLAWWADPAASAAVPSLAAARDSLVASLRAVHGLTDSQVAEVRAVLAKAAHIGQGNPAVTRYAASAAECRERLRDTGTDYTSPRFQSLCGGPFMAPLYDPATEGPQEARACIDQFEFPNIPCAHPVVWVRAREAAQLCAAVGKRLCDAHEWEGACAGALEPPDYRFDLAAGHAPAAAVAAMRKAHNAARASTRAWSYGPEYRKGVCGAASAKSADCPGGSWSQCGSNTYPAGSFPECRSALQVYDLHGNAAEHMNLPLDPGQMSSRGSTELGVTEMKGSWFIFDRVHAHEDWCRWRAPFWHGSRVMDTRSHHNYHLGFRCCRTVAGEATSAAPSPP